LIAIIFEKKIYLIFLAPISWPILFPTLNCFFMHSTPLFLGF
jgi:hypothetical protein